ncbi:MULTISPECIES: hypothetical protein [unclassified Streptomyces]|uniref:hypothetical protein n=1 Tax=unclassified Streptomyces TaxID=2593676 RepID=UPI00340955F2
MSGTAGRAARLRAWWALGSPVWRRQSLVVWVLFAVTLALAGAGYVIVIVGAGAGAMVTALFMHLDRVTARRRGDVAHANRLLPPEDFPYPAERGEVGDALALLALRETMRRALDLGPGFGIQHALTLGATWREIAAALDTTPDKARELLREHADGQRVLHIEESEHGHERPRGFTGSQYAAVYALTELGDDDVLPLHDHPEI